MPVALLRISGGPSADAVADKPPARAPPPSLRGLGRRAQPSGVYQSPATPTVARHRGAVRRRAQRGPIAVVPSRPTAGAATLSALPAAPPTRRCQPSRPPLPALSSRGTAASPAVGGRSASLRLPPAPVQVAAAVAGAMAFAVCWSGRGHGRGGAAAAAAVGAPPRRGGALPRRRALARRGPYRPAAPSRSSRPGGTVVAVAADPPGHPAGGGVDAIGGGGGSGAAAASAAAPAAPALAHAR